MDRGPPLPAASEAMDRGVGTRKDDPGESPPLRVVPGSELMTLRGHRFLPWRNWGIGRGLLLDGRGETSS
jgi:hypothetical protein